MALLFLSEAFEGDEWRKLFDALVPGIDFRVWPEFGTPEDVEMVMAWKIPPGALGRFPNLRCVAALGHGVDEMLNDPDLPADVPLTRLVDDSMKRQMPAWVLAAVLRHHCKFAAYAELQRAARWRVLEPVDPADTRVGILGLGALGAACARHLVALGFAVSGWSRTPKDIPGVESFTGRDALEAFLGRCDIVVCLLPLTPDTEGVLNAKTFAAMRRGAYLVNAARGGHVVEDDLLAALESGQVSGACLDVFRAEPLPPESPFWKHPKVIVTPHIAAETFARSSAPQVAENYKRLRGGRPLLNVVDRERGY